MTFHFKDFVSHVGQPGIEVELKHLPSFPEGLDECLVCGPESSGKTTMLIHFAVRLAAEGKNVLFACCRSKAEEVPSALPQGVHAKDPMLANIHMRYLNSRSELLKYAACLHLLPFAPDAIVVDDLSHFHSPTERAGSTEIMKVLATLIDATEHFRALGRQCQLLISELGSEKPDQLYEHWLPLILHIKDAHDWLKSAPSARQPLCSCPILPVIRRLSTVKASQVRLLLEKTVALTKPGVHRDSCLVKSSLPERKEGMLLSAIAPQGALTDMPQLHFSLHPYSGTQLQQILPAH